MPLTITVPGDSEEIWDPISNEFITCKKQKVTLEHSLVSISKWEAKWHIPFLEEGLKTQEQLIDYIRCMTITQNVDDNVFKLIAASPSLLNQVTEYMADPMTATWFSEDKTPTRSREKMTSELIYYMMIAFNIPPEYQKWHLQRLLTLIRICSIKNEPPKKMGKNEIRSHNRALNAARRKRLGSPG
jgi:hypothetical protein